MLSQVLRSGITSAIQGLIILVVCLFLGTTNGGPLGWLLIVVAAVLVSAGFSGISQAVALLTRREATMIAVANFIGLPLMFFSAMLIDCDLIPVWMQWAARVNPVQWAVDAARTGAALARLWTRRRLARRARGLHGSDVRARDAHLPRIPANVVRRRCRLPWQQAGRRHSDLHERSKR